MAKIVGVYYALEGRHLGGDWKRVRGELQHNFYRVVENKRDYEEILKENPEEMTWTEFRVIKIEETVLDVD